jgi:DNA-binding transcriptional regulator YhcF (GntR family)
MYESIETMNLHLDPSSPVPPFEQIRSQIQAMVASGALPTGTRLPSIRQLAGDLGLAVNTVGRAYRELERDGIVAARGRHGTIVTGPAAMDGARRREVVDDAAAAFALEALHHGAGLDDAMAAVRKAFARIRGRAKPSTPKTPRPRPKTARPAPKQGEAPA